MKSFLFLLPLIFFFGCATRTLAPKTSIAPEQVPGHAASPNPVINMVGLQNYLGLTRSSKALGYQEKSFQTCLVGNGFPRDRNCQTKHFIVIHFQLMCRDSEGTISTILTVADLQPLSRRPVIWTLKDLSNTVQTDEDGYGQIMAITTSPQSQQRLKLSAGNDFLYMRAGEIKRVATPPSWCSEITSASK